MACCTAVVWASLCQRHDRRTASLILACDSLAAIWHDDQAARLEHFEGAACIMFLLVKLCRSASDQLAGAVWIDGAEKPEKLAML